MHNSLKLWKEEQWKEKEKQKKDQKLFRFYLSSWDQNISRNRQSS